MSRKDLAQTPFSVDCSPPDANLYHFEGRLSINGARINLIYSAGHNLRQHSLPTGETQSLGIKQLLLAGARLRNTATVTGIAVYTGKDSKAVLNEPKITYKFSSVESRLNHFLFVYFVWLIIVGFNGLGCEMKLKRKLETHPLFPATDLHHLSRVL